MKRIKGVVKTSVIGIITNLFLVIFKIAIGFISGAISLIMDGINNLTDALSSTITLVGMVLASKKPDKEHPYGHGKIEYFSALSIALIIILTGISSFFSSFQKIFHPTNVKYSTVMLVIIFVGILIKLALGRYFQRKGEELKSDCLMASGKDALFDAVIALSTLVGAFVVVIFNYSIDGYLGVAISLFIFKSGVDILKKSINDIIGSPVDPSLEKNIKKTINTFANILGSYDLILHQYGPDNIMGSIHIEVADNMKAKEIHALTRKVSEEVYHLYKVRLTIGIYATNTDDDEYLKIKKHIKSLIKKYPSIHNFHGYYVDNEKKHISFDLIFDFKEKNIAKIKNNIINNLQSHYPDYKYMIILDKDFSE